MSFPYSLDLAFGSEKATADTGLSKVPSNLNNDSEEDNQNNEQNPSPTVEPGDNVLDSPKG